jgi:hypothetical protein
MRYTYMLAMFVIGCGGNETNYLQVLSVESGDNNLTQDILTFVSDNINAGLGCKAIGDDFPEKRKFITIRFNDEIIAQVAEEQDKPRTAGVFRSVTNEIIFHSKLFAPIWRETFEVAMLHELAHAFGLKHVHGGFMEVEPASFDEALISFVRLMNDNDMNPCITSIQSFPNYKQLNPLELK